MINTSLESQTAHSLQRISGKSKDAAEFKGRLLQGLTMNMEIQLQPKSKSVRNISIISFRNHMMTAIQQHESEGTGLFEGKGRNSLSTSPEVFILNNRDVYIHTENGNVTTLANHVTFACIHYSPLSFHLTLTVPLLAIKVLYVCATEQSEYFLSQWDQTEMSVTSYCILLCCKSLGGNYPY